MTVSLKGAPPCTQRFMGTCFDCDVLLHPTHLTSRCAEGHRVHGGYNRCTRCIQRRTNRGTLPAFSLRKSRRFAGRQSGRPRAGAPRPRPLIQTGTVTAPCDRCGHLAPLRIGPGEALCEPCGGAEVLDRALA